jgi:hypothetical protein
MQELTNSIKRPNLRIIGIEEGEEVQEKGICNMFKENTNRKFPKSRENYAHSGTGSLQDTKQTDQNRTTPQHIIIKPTRTENREIILKPIEEKKQITYKGKPIKITADFSTETLKARRAWSEVFWGLKEINFNPRTL